MLLLGHMDQQQLNPFNHNQTANHQKLARTKSNIKTKTTNWLAQVQNLLNMLQCRAVTHAAMLTITGALLLDQLCMMLVVPVIPLYLLDHYQNDTSAEIHEKSGLIIATKGFVQVITSLFISSPLTARFGYTRTLVLGLIGMAVSCEVFALSGSMAQLIFARALQGISSSLVNAAGLSSIAQQYRGNSAARDRAMGIAMCAMCIGYSSGPPFASVLYTIGDKPLPFHVSTVIMGIMAALVARISPPQSNFNTQAKHNSSDTLTETDSDDEHHVNNKLHESTANAPATQSSKNKTPSLSVGRLLQDRYIALCLCDIIVSCLPVSALEAVLTIWMNDNVPDTTEATVGLVWLPSSLAMLSATYATTALMGRNARYHRQIIQFALAVVVTASVLLPVQQTAVGVSACLTLLMFGEMQVETAVVPLISDIIDQRYGSNANYGSGYALWDMAYSAVETAGPLLGAACVARVGMMPFMLVAASLAALCMPLNRHLVHVLHNNPPSYTPVGEQCI